MREVDQYVACETRVEVRLDFRGSRYLSYWDPYLATTLLKDLKPW